MSKINKIRVHGKAQNRTVLGIINAYLVMYPQTTAEQLREAFPTSLLNKDKRTPSRSENPWTEEGFFHEIVERDGKRYWKATDEEVGTTTIEFEQEDELLHTADGKVLAMDSIWAANEFKAMVEWAKQYDIEVASFQKTQKTGERGSFRLEYLNGYEPPVAAAFATLPEKSEPVEEPKEEEPEECCKFVWIVSLLLLLLFFFLLFRSCEQRKAEDANAAQGEQTDEWVSDVKDSVMEVLSEPVAEEPVSAFDTMPEEVKQELKEEVSTIQKKFNTARFVQGKADLTPETKAVLDDMADFLKNNPALKMRVVGHSSSEGDPDYNQKLSEQRAQAAVDYLISCGVSPEQLKGEGKGISEPISDNPSENRRTEFLLE
jgi:outer membrane protein OmpA-like peptidoglycan-associated protein